VARRELGKKPTFSDEIELDLGAVEPSLAGPKRPQDRVSLSQSQVVFQQALRDYVPSDGDQADARTRPSPSPIRPLTRPRTARRATRRSLQAPSPLSLPEAARRPFRTTARRPA